MTAVMTFGLLVVITTALTEVAKKAFKLETNICPLASVILGIILVFVARSTETGTMVTEFSPVFTGVMAGLGASGLFDWKRYLGK